MVELYRFTHKAISLINDNSADSNASSPGNNVPAEINLPNLTMFSTILFMTEFRQMGMGDSVDVSKTCNMSEWHRRLYEGVVGTPQSDSNPYVNVLTLPPKPVSESGVIYATTTRLAGQDGGKEAFSSFLFAIHKPSFAKTIPTAINGDAHRLPLEAEALVAAKGATHIWLCGSDPEHRRHRLMSRCLAQLEQDVLEWKANGQGSGVLTVHTIPKAFPGMVHFLTKNGFVGGDKVIGGDGDKVLYWKVL
ncbi:hypothetical protein BGZ97_011209 [Linnemannia gamsii]|jgi:GNAT superfamily N-acetyltransferase|uniref:N-acetyltransferase domain-containing protein n=1 Tax=Linnemannia gamsii TaxID=64522 RepID=A0A9P6R8M4_9FUNG|nr:hypothetical protein BGZ97_011209 [Linnemannia gamsii]